MDCRSLGGSPFLIVSGLAIDAELVGAEQRIAGICTQRSKEPAQPVPRYPLFVRLLDGGLARGQGDGRGDRMLGWYKAMSGVRKSRQRSDPLARLERLVCVGQTLDRR